ncbi:hypothetical protein LJR225_002167 [Phenylobacterium sp. LjRoot225]|uniref:hypothetical protein n=1 Tax=Phenylobacterium sp. LjRoot225 TaxID=3342285 RepID=UPI003ECE6B18
MPDNRFELTKLSFNIGAPQLPGADLASCNSGGSVICNPGTGGCGGAAMTCVGTSCSGKSGTMWGFDANILINPVDLEALQEEVMTVVQKFAARTK